MRLRYKMDVLAALNAKGYTTYKLRRDKLLGESTIQKLRNGEGISWANLETLCELLNCQPGELLEYKEE